MIVKTVKAKYRDISIQEVRKCFPTADAVEWEGARGKEAEFVIPPNDDPRDSGVCKEPLYRQANTPWIACCHIAEIGD